MYTYIYVLSALSLYMYLSEFYHCTYTSVNVNSAKCVSSDETGRLAMMSLRNFLMVDQWSMPVSLHTLPDTSAKRAMSSWQSEKRRDLRLI